MRGIRGRRLFLNAVLFHAVDEGLAAQFQQGGGVGLVPVRSSQGPQYEFLFDGVHADTVRRQLDLIRLHGRAFPAQLTGQIFQPDFPALGQDYQPLDDIFRGLSQTGQGSRSSRIQ
jgi:hypothetical protein